MFEIHHVQLACPAGAEDELRMFYAGLLGLTEVAKPPVLAARGGAWFRSGQAELHLGVEGDFRPARKAHPGLALSNDSALQTLAGRLTDASHPVMWDDGFPGFARFYSTDPVGNRLEFLAARRG